MHEAIKYPDITFWNSEKSALNVVNPQDLLVKEIMRILGVGATSFIKLTAVSDRDEILRRQEVFNWLSKNPDVVSMLLTSHLSSDVSTDPNQFLFDFNPERKEPSEFLETLSHMMGVLNKSTDNFCPKEVRSFIDFLNNNFLQMRKREEDFSSKVFEFVSTAAELNSVFNLTVKEGVERCSSAQVNFVDMYTLGYRLHSHRPLASKKWDLDSAIFTKFSFVSKCFRKFAIWRNAAYDRVVYGPQVIRATPESLKYLVIDVANALFKDVNSAERYTWKVKLGITYESGKLFVKILDLELDLDKIDCKEQAKATASRELCFDADVSFPGYSLKDSLEITRRIQSLKRQSVGKHLDNVEKARLFAIFFYGEKTSRYFSRRGCEVVSEEFAREFAYYSISGLCLGEDSSVKNEFDEVNVCRKYVSGLFSQLTDMAKIVSTLQKKSKEWNVPLSFPKILEDEEHVFCWSSLFPFHLTKTVEPVKIVPIGQMPDLADKIISVTGHNAGGKTVILETVAISLYLAQCGLPVFGTNVKLNVKRAMGLVFIERGTGSTVELLLRKLKAVIDVADSSKPSQCVVIIDEMGTGTQAGDGLELADQVLKVLVHSGCTVIFSTQITELVKRLERSDLISLKVDRCTRKITEGIGTGDVLELAKDLDLFSKDSK